METASGSQNLGRFFQTEVFAVAIEYQNATGKTLSLIDQFGNIYNRSGWASPNLYAFRRVIGLQNGFITETVELLIIWVKKHVFYSNQNTVN
jgi:hypothetical protein